jgi:hypothetical protein
MTHVFAGALLSHPLTTRRDRDQRFDRL